MQPNNHLIKFWKGLKIFLLAYCLVGIAVYYLQDYFIFHPVPLANGYNYVFNQRHNGLNIAYNDKANISIVQFPGKQKNLKGVVLYFHGNKGNIERYARFAPIFTNNGYEVWMIDYPGFGKSTGEFTEQRVYDWSLLMYNLARKKYGRDSIILYGKSLGTGIASQLASIRDCKLLVLETPYYSLTSLASRYFWMYPISNMMQYKFPTNQHLAKVTARIIIFHGTNDKVIPYKNAVQLKADLKKGDEFITLAGGNHLNLNTFPIMQHKLDTLLK